MLIYIILYPPTTGTALPSSSAIPKPWAMEDFSESPMLPRSSFPSMWTTPRDRQLARLGAVTSIKSGSFTGLWGDRKLEACLCSLQINPDLFETEQTWHKLW